MGDHNPADTGAWGLLLLNCNWACVLPNCNWVWGLLNYRVVEVLPTNCKEGGDLLLKSMEVLDLDFWMEEPRGRSRALSTFDQATHPGSLDILQDPLVDRSRRVVAADPAWGKGWGWPVCGLPGPNPWDGHVSCRFP